MTPTIPRRPRRICDDRILTVESLILYSSHYGSATQSEHKRNDAGAGSKRITTTWSWVWETSTASSGESESLPRTGR